VSAHDTSVENAPICTGAQLDEALADMDQHCKAKLLDAVSTETPLSEEVRCECFEQVDELIGLKMHCRTMDEKTMTLAQEYQQCVTQDLGTTCTLNKLYGSDGLIAMSDDCKATMRAGGVVPCDCFDHVPVQNALSLKCEATADTDDNIAFLYQQCILAAVKD